MLQHRQVSLRQRFRLRHLRQRTEKSAKENRVSNSERLRQLVEEPQQLRPGCRLEGAKRKANLSGQSRVKPQPNLAARRKPKAVDTKAHRPERNLQQQRPLHSLRVVPAVLPKPKAVDPKAHRPEHNLQQQRPLHSLRVDLAARRKPKAADTKARRPERNLPLRLLNAAREDRQAEKRKARPLRLQLHNRRQQFDYASAPDSSRGRFAYGNWLAGRARLCRADITDNNSSAPYGCLKGLKATPRFAPH